MFFPFPQRRLKIDPGGSSGPSGTGAYTLVRRLVRLRVWGFGEVPAEENKVSERGFKLTLARCSGWTARTLCQFRQSLLTVHRSMKHELCAYYVCFQFVLSLALCILMFARALSSLKTVTPILTASSAFSSSQRLSSGAVICRSFLREFI